MVTHSIQLLEAAALGNAESVLRLIKANADIDAKNKAGFTSLEVAVRRTGAVVHFRYEENERREKYLPAEQYIKEEMLARVKKRANIGLIVPPQWYVDVATDGKGESFEKKLLDRYDELKKTQLNDDACIKQLIAESRSPYFEVIKLLLEHNANPDPQTDELSPLQIASRDGWADVTKLLCDRKANVHYECDKNSGSAAFLEAVERGHFKNVQLLYPHQAKENLSTTLHQAMCNAVCCARSENYLDVVRFLLDQGADANTVDDEGQTVLMHACRAYSNYKPHLDVVKLLITRGADVNKITRGGTALVAALASRYRLVEYALGYIELVEALLALGATPRDAVEINAIYRLRLWDALKNHRFPEAETLLKNNAWKLPKARKGSFIIEMMPRNLDYPILAFLTRYEDINAMVEIDHKRDGTTLIYAVDVSSWTGLDIVLMLLKFGAKPTIADSKGKTVFDLVEDAGYDDRSGKYGIRCLIRKIKNA